MFEGLTPPVRPCAATGPEVPGDDLLLLGEGHCCLMRVWMGVWLQHCGPAIGVQCAAMGSVISGAAVQTSLGYMRIGDG